MVEPQIIDQTEEYYVIDKPAGMATEPPSNSETLREWLEKTGHIKAGEWSQESRGGIVHRLDTDTSGVIIWAKNENSQEKLRSMWQGRQVEKVYVALVTGRTEPTGTIEMPIMRDNRNDRQTVAMLPNAKSRPAITNFQTLAHGKVGENAVSLVEAHPITGRTHQIRVHFKSIGHPLVGDKLYGEKGSDKVAQSINLNRQFLHAWKINLQPSQTYQATLPDDLLSALEKTEIVWPIES